MNNEISTEVETVSFNLNYDILVKLKPDGYKHWMKKYNRFLGNEGRNMEYFKSKENADGYVSFHAWEFIQMFGETIVFGDSPIFETTIKIEKRYLKED